MHQSFCDGLSVDYSCPNPASEPTRHCTTQSTDSSTDLAGVEAYYTPSPTLQVLETTQPSSHPHPHPHPQPQPQPQPQPHPLPHSGLYPASIDTAFQIYPHSHVRSAGSSSQGMWPTPPSTTCEGDDFDGYSYHGSPTSGASGVQPAPRYSADSSAASPRSWSSPELQQSNFQPAVWRLPEQLPSYNMSMRVCPPLPYEERFHHPMATSPYDNHSFSLRSNPDPDSLMQQDVPPMVPDIPDPEPSLSAYGESPRMKEEFESSYNMDDDEEVQNLQASGPANPSDGDDGGKVDEPYAQLIYRAFMSRDRHAMTLQEIYQWFREKTDKAKSENKGWQNSIRHNLSMNAAFIKRDRKPSTSDLITDTGEAKKSTEWVLEEWAVRDGVQSTTRYRKGNTGRRGGSGSHARAHGNNLSARANSGRKGGITASKTKAAATRRTMMSRPQNPAFLGSQRDPMREGLYEHSLGYNYVPSSRDEPVTPPDANTGDLMFRGSMAAAGVPASSSSQGYTYANNTPHSQSHHNYPQQHHPTAVYSIQDVADVYQGPQMHASGRVQGTTVSLPPAFSALFANAEDLEDDRVTSYMHWNDSAPGGPYQP